MKTRITIKRTSSTPTNFLKINFRSGQALLKTAHRHSTFPSTSKQSWNPCIYRTFQTQVKTKSTTSEASAAAACAKKMESLFQKGHYDQVEKEWKRFSLTGRTASSAMFGIIMKVYATRGNIVSFDKIWHKMFQQNLSPNLHHYTAKISCLCKCNDIRRAEKVIDGMKQHDMQPTTEIYNILLKGYCDHAPTSPAIQYLYDMLIEKNMANDSTYGIMIKHYGKNNLQQAADIVDQLAKQNKANNKVYNSLLAVCCDTNQLDRVGFFLEQMKAAGIEKDIWTYRTLLKSFTDVEKLNKFFDEFRDFGAQPKDYSHYVSYVSVHGTLNDLMKALQLLRQDGIPYTPDLFQFIFHNVNKTGKLDIIQPVLQFMKENRVPVNVVACAAILNAYGSSNQLKQMHQTFEELRLIVTPDSYCMCTVIEKCYQHQSYDKAIQYFNYSLARKIELPEATLVHVAVSYVLLHQWPQVEGLLKQYGMKDWLVVPLITTITNRFPEEISSFYANVTKNVSMCLSVHGYYLRQKRYNDALALIKDMINNIDHYSQLGTQTQWSQLSHQIETLSSALKEQNDNAAVWFLQEATRVVNDRMITPQQGPKKQDVPLWKYFTQKDPHALGAQPDNNIPNPKSAKEPVPEWYRKHPPQVNYVPEWYRNPPREANYVPEWYRNAKSTPTKHGPKRGRFLKPRPPNNIPEWYRKHPPQVNYVPEWYRKPPREVDYVPEWYTELHVRKQYGLPSVNELVPILDEQLEYPDQPPYWSNQ